MTVHCWNSDGGPESRTQLLGIYIGAKVFRIGSLTSHDQAEGIDVRFTRTSIDLYLNTYFFLLF